MFYKKHLDKYQPLFLFLFINIIAATFKIQISFVQ